MAIDVDTMDQAAVGAFAERVMGDCVGGLTVPPAHALYELRP